MEEPLYPPKDKGGNRSGRALIDWFNIFVDFMMGPLSATQIKVFLIYLRHADVKGEAYPGMDSIGWRMGIGNVPDDATEDEKKAAKRMRIRKARKAVAEVTSMGLLELVGDGPKPSSAKKRRIVISKDGCPKKALTPRAQKRHSPPVPKMGQSPCPKEARPPVPKMGAPLLIGIERPIQRLNERPNNNSNGGNGKHDSAGSIVVDGRKLNESEEQKAEREAATVEALRDEKINLTKSHPLWAVIRAGLTAEHVKAAAGEFMFTRGAKNPAGLLCRLLIDRGLEIIAGTYQPRDPFGRPSGQRTRREERAAKEYPSDIPTEERVYGDSKTEPMPTFEIKSHDKRVLDSIGDWSLDWHTQQVLAEMPKGEIYRRANVTPGDVRSARYSTLIPLIVQSIQRRKAPNHVSRNDGTVWQKMENLPEA